MARQRKQGFYFNLAFVHPIFRHQNGTLDALILDCGRHTQYMTQQAWNRRQFNKDIWKRKCIDRLQNELKEHFNYLWIWLIINASLVLLFRVFLMALIKPIALQSLIYVCRQCKYKNTTTAWCSVLEWLCQWSVKIFYWVNNWISYIANAGNLNFNMVPHVPGFNFIDIKRNRDISTLWFKPCFYWFGATQVETKLSLLISYKDSEPLHTVNLCFSLSGYSKIVRLGCSTLGHFLSVNFSRRINWATEWGKKKKRRGKSRPPALLSVSLQNQ